MRRVILICVVCSSFGCSLFSDGPDFTCEDLVVTGEDGPEVQEIRGNPSGQWDVIGLDNVEIPENHCEPGTECEVGYDEFRVYAAYPNPIKEGNTSILVFINPVSTNVKITIEDHKGENRETILDWRLPAGQHSVNTVLQGKDSGCYKAEYYFGDGDDRNAYGLILVEE